MLCDSLDRELLNQDPFVRILFLILIQQGHGVGIRIDPAVLLQRIGARFVQRHNDIANMRFRLLSDNDHIPILNARILNGIAGCFQDVEFTFPEKGHGKAYVLLNVLFFLFRRSAMGL